MPTLQERVTAFHYVAQLLCHIYIPSIFLLWGTLSSNLFGCFSSSLFLVGHVYTLCRVRWGCLSLLAACQDGVAAAGPGVPVPFAADTKNDLLQ